MKLVASIFDFPGESGTLCATKSVLSLSKGIMSEHSAFAPSFMVALMSDKALVTSAPVDTEHGEFIVNPGKVLLY